MSVGNICQISCPRFSAYKGYSSRIFSWKAAGASASIRRIVGNRNWQMTSAKGLYAYMTRGLGGNGIYIGRFQHFPRKLISFLLVQARILQIASFINVYGQLNTI